MQNRLTDSDTRVIMMLVDTDMPRVRFLLTSTITKLLIILPRIDIDSTIRDERCLFWRVAVSEAHEHVNNAR